MTRTKPLFRIIAVLMVCVMLFVCSPIRAEAVVLDTVLVYAPAVIGAILLGIGVFQVTGTDAWQNAVNDCVNALKAGTDWITDENNISMLAEVTSDGVTSRYAADVELIEWVRQWLFDNAVVQQHSVTTYEDGFTTLCIENNNHVEIQNYWSNFSIYEAANSVTAGFLLIGKIGNLFWGMSIDGNRIYSGESSSLAPFTDSNYPAGRFIDVSEMTYYSSGTLNDTRLYTNYESAYEAWQTSPGAVYYLNTDTMIVPSLTNSTNYYAYLDFANLGLISFDGTISVVDYEIKFCSYSAKTWTYAVIPNSTSNTGFVSGDNDISLGFIADPSIPISDGYAEWAEGAIVDGDTTYLPVGHSANLESTSGLTQEQVWTGSVYPAVPEFEKEIAPGIVYYSQGQTATPLVVNATSPDGLTITYQWYADGFPIDGATSSVFVPPTTAIGSTTYTCRVGNGTNSANVTYSSTFSVTVQVLSADVDTEPTISGKVEADQFQDTVTDSMTDYDNLQGVLDGADLPDYGDIDPSFGDIFGKDGIKLAAQAIGTLFNDSYIFRVFFIAFMLGCVSFVVFGKRS